MNRLGAAGLRGRLILIFLAATLIPLAATWWITISLLDQSLTYSSTDQLDRLSKTLAQAGRELYQHARASLKSDALAGRVAPERLPRAQASQWPAAVAQFWESGDAERFVLSVPDGDRITYLLRRPTEVLAYSAPIGPLGLTRMSDEYRRAREAIDETRERDLRRGFITTFAILAASVWLVSLTLLVVMAYRVSGPIRQLTDGLDRLASGDLHVQITNTRNDEIGRAIRAFNSMAAHLAESRERLVYLTQLASWQLLARKMAHELKNSLTPIRLTMEEILARDTGGDRFLEQAARIVVDEVDSLGRRIRAFSEFAKEPPLRPRLIAVNESLTERISFLKSGHPEVSYDVQLAPEDPMAFADADLLNGILTNLLENAAEAAGSGGTVVATTALDEGKVWIEVHDSGPGLSEEAQKFLFEPTISFKKRGMGLGLSIARKNALLMGGDITLIPGRLAGAAFRVTLPVANPQPSAISEAPADSVVSPHDVSLPERNLIADRRGLD